MRKIHLTIHEPIDYRDIVSFYTNCNELTFVFITENRRDIIIFNKAFVKIPRAYAKMIDKYNGFKGLYS